MGFHTGNYTIKAFIAELVADLVATPDFEMVDDAVPTDGFCIRYIPENLYVRIAKSGGTSRYKAETNWTWTGLRIQFSTGYDIGTHASAGTVFSGAAPLYGYPGKNTGTNLALIDDTRTFPITYYADRFGIIAAIENPNVGSNAVGFYLVIEFVPEEDRFYADGYSSVFFHCKYGGTTFEQYWSPFSLTDHTTLSYMNLRPFFRGQTMSMVSLYGVSHGIRSIADGKIYFEFPMYHNALNAESSSAQINYTDPIFQTRRWFLASSAGNLTAGDAITWLDESDPENPVERVFILCEFKSATSSSTAEPTLIAVPYANAYQYTIPPPPEPEE